jgi:hypothetical protein
MESNHLSLLLLAHYMAQQIWGKSDISWLQSCITKGSMVFPEFSLSLSLSPLSLSVTHKHTHTHSQNIVLWDPETSPATLRPPCCIDLIRIENNAVEASDVATPPKYFQPKRHENKQLSSDSSSQSSSHPSWCQLEQRQAIPVDL